MTIFKTLIYAVILLASNYANAALFEMPNPLQISFFFILFVGIFMIVFGIKTIKDFFDHREFYLSDFLIAPLGCFIIYFTLINYGFYYM